MFTFRWEDGQEKTTDKGIITYKHDRWTGQDFIKKYSFTGTQTESPSLDEYSLSLKVNQIKQENETGHKDYEKLENELISDFERKTPKPTMESDSPRTINWGFAVFAPPGTAEWEKDKNSYVSSQMPANLSSSHSKWIGAEDIAKSELAERYYFTRNLATCIWVILVVISVLWTWRSYVKQKRGV
ncbi:MAG TPA: hypothetical protein DCY27_05555 [Desulfobacterales bacterium]|nr:hypothetical protein [Desulfobacterales bacterium]